MEQNTNAPLLDETPQPTALGKAARVVFGTAINTLLGTMIGVGAGVGLDVAMNDGALTDITKGDVSKTATTAFDHYTDSAYVQGAALAGGVAGAASGLGVLGKWTQQVQNERATREQEGRGLA